MKGKLANASTGSFIITPLLSTVLYIHILKKSCISYTTPENNRVNSPIKNTLDEEWCTLIKCAILVIIHRIVSRPDIITGYNNDYGLDTATMDLTGQFYWKV